MTDEERKDKDVQRRRNITLSDHWAKIAKRIGGGNISKGIRRALEHFINFPPKNRKL